MVLQFIRSWGPYNEGEVAGFDAEVEKDLIKRGYAKPFEQGGARGAVPTETESSKAEPVPRAKGVVRVPPTGVAKKPGRGRR